MKRTILKDNLKEQKLVQRLVRCCQCGVESELKDMGYVGYNVCKCAFCLLGMKA